MEKAGESDFTALVDRLVKEHLLLWETSSSQPPEITRHFTGEEQRHHEFACDRMFDRITQLLHQYPAVDPRKQLQWRQQLSSCVREFCEYVIGYSHELSEVLFSHNNFAATQTFVRMASKFNGGLSTNDMHQALRNTWVMNSIQLLLGREVSCSHSVFAYSMLYPYTDNYIDDATLPIENKQKLNRWLSRRLSGLESATRSSHEQALSELVGLIECEHDRSKAFDVFASLLAIHNAQNDSLHQQTSTTITDAELLRVSMQKGGTSVLAHGFLVNQELTEAEASFIFGYGVFLQLLDDLQDVSIDAENQHATLFTEARRRQNLDAITSRLYAFMQRVLAKVICFSTTETPVVCELIETNCRLLLLQAVAMHQAAFSDEFVARMEAWSPLGSEYFGQLPNLLWRRFQLLESEFEGQFGRSIQSVLTD